MQAVENRQVERVSSIEAQQCDQISSASVGNYAADSLGASSTTLESSDTTVSATDEVVITTTKEYDTSKPLDERTGLPPIKRETTELRHKQNGKVSASKISQTAEATSRTSQEYEQRDTLSLISTTARNQEEQVAETVESKQNTESAERRGLNGWQNALCWFGGIVLLAIICYLVFMIIKRKLKII